MVNERDEFDDLLDRRGLKKNLRVCAWIKKFTFKCRGLTVASGPLTVAQLEPLVEGWIRRVHSRAVNPQKFANDERQLNLQANADGILECLG